MVLPQLPSRDTVPYNICAVAYIFVEANKFYNLLIPILKTIRKVFKIQFGPPSTFRALIYQQMNLNLLCVTFRGINAARKNAVFR
jgi:hypothetical protein